MKILITGSTGLVGSAAVAKLETDGHEIVRLVRSRPKPGQNAVQWNPQTLALDRSVMPEDTGAVIHLAGENIFGRWTARKKAEIRNSRVITTDLLAGLASTMQDPPKVFINASAVGVYGNRGDEELTESSGYGTGFLADVGRDWEGATQRAADRGIRTVLLRFGVVVTSRGGALKKMLTPFKLGLGGPIGDGKQWMPWIDLDDVAEIIRIAVTDDRYSGPINLVAPQQVTNKEFSETLARLLGKKAGFAVPPALLRIATGDLADEALLVSERVIPARLQQLGFVHKYPTLEESLRHWLSA